MAVTNVKAAARDAGVTVNGIKVIDEQQSNVVDLTDNSGGAASDTIAAIGATYDQAEVRNAVASLAAKVAELNAVFEAHGLTASS